MKGVREFRGRGHQRKKRGKSRRPAPPIIERERSVNGRPATEKGKLKRGEERKNAGTSGVPSKTLR